MNDLEKYYVSVRADGKTGHFTVNAESYEDAADQVGKLFNTELTPYHGEVMFDEEDEPYTLPTNKFWYDKNGHRINIDINLILA